VGLEFLFPSQNLVLLQLPTNRSALPAGTRDIRTTRLIYCSDTIDHRAQNSQHFWTHTASVSKKRITQTLGCISERNHAQRARSPRDHGANLAARPLVAYCNIPMQSRDLESTPPQPHLSAPCPRKPVFYTADCFLKNPRLDLRLDSKPSPWGEILDREFELIPKETGRTAS